MVLLTYVIFLQVILQAVASSDQRVYTHSPVTIVKLPKDALEHVRSRNELIKPALTVTLPASHGIQSRSSSISKRDGCYLDSQCGGDQYCCPSILGSVGGQCYSNSSKCCVWDGNILPENIVSTLPSNIDACSYTSDTSYTICPGNGTNSAFTKCAANGEGCTSSCNSDSDCASTAGSSCCLAASSNPTQGHRCKSSAEVCCFDGRVCDSKICTIPSGGQCCGVDPTADGIYSYCTTGFCSFSTSGSLQCTTVNNTFPLQYTPTKSSSSNLKIILAIAIPVGIVVIAAIAAIIFIVVKRRRTNNTGGRIVEPTVPPHYKESAMPMAGVNGTVPGTYHRLSIKTSNVPIPPSYNQVVRPDGGHYAAMEAVPNGSGSLLRAHDTAIDWSEIEMITSIGRGSFGEAYRAKWHEAVVAVKKIHADLLGNAEAINNFYAETEMLKNLKPHPNTVLFFGVTKEPIAIIMEYCENGSLHQFLHSPIAISLSMKRNFLLGIARGMLHLHFYNVIHRDLAARNILLTSSLDVKVSDFGFSRELEGTNENRIKTTVGPVFWFPPEALRDHIFSTKTDVWSFGVVVWEVLTRKEPFENKSPSDVIVGVTQSGMTVEIPNDCPPMFANLMRMCFQQDPASRPTFKEICTILETEPTTTVTA